MADAPPKRINTHIRAPLLPHAPRGERRLVTPLVASSHCYSTVCITNVDTAGKMGCDRTLAQCACGRSGCVGDDEHCRGMRNAARALRS